MARQLPCWRRCWAPRWKTGPPSEKPKESNGAGDRHLPVRAKCKCRTLARVKHQTAQVSKPYLFVGTDVMPRVAAALPKRGPTVAAIAYVTQDHLGLGREDALAVNVSTAAVRSGATDPTLLLELLARDVIIVNQPTLHAKAIRRGKTVAIGSANLSGRTSSLQELM